MFLNHYIFTLYILWHTYHTLNAQFAEFHLCTPVVLNKVMDETVEFGVFTFCERFKVRWPILIYNAMQPTIFPSYLTSFSWHFLESPVWIKSILSHWFRAVDTPNLLWLFHASLIQFDPVWSSFHIILSTIELSSMSFCAVLLWFYCPSCTYSQNHTYFHNPEVPIFGTTWDFTNLSTSTMKWFHFMRIYWCEWHYLLIIMVHILPTI